MRKNDKPLTEALLKILREPFPGDPKGRLGCELLALAIYKSAIGGSTPSAVLIAERTEGKIKDKIEINESRRTTEEIHERIRELTEKFRGKSERVQ